MSTWVRVRRLVVAALAVGVIAAACGPTKPAGPSHGTAVYGCTQGAQAFTVPAGITAIAVDAFGAQGGNHDNFDVPPPGGLGGRAAATIAVVPGEILQVNVGCRGGDSDLDGTVGTGGFGGGPGGPGGAAGGGPGGDGNGPGAGGGGGSDVRRAGNRLVAAGGGGGTAGSNDEAGGGGAGGGATGVAGGDGNPIGNDVTGGGPGTGSAPGAGGDGSVAPNDGVAGNGATGGAGGATSQLGEKSGGGGGGGYYGGGGGGGDNANLSGGGGGGGSGVGPAGTVFQTGVRTGNGLVVIYY